MESPPPDEESGIGVGREVELGVVSGGIVVSFWVGVDVSEGIVVVVMVVSSGGVVVVVIVVSSGGVVVIVSTGVTIVVVAVSSGGVVVTVVVSSGGIVVSTGVVVSAGAIVSSGVVSSGLGIPSSAMLMPTIRLKQNITSPARTRPCKNHLPRFTLLTIMLKTHNLLDGKVPGARR